jgi:prolyl 4-hydroxylase
MGTLRAWILTTALLANTVLAQEEGADYGVDVSFPIHHRQISDNFAWLPHNVDPKNNKQPARYKDMVVQPLPGREELYQDFLSTCEKAFGSKGSRCRMTEQDRIDMSLRQPQSMQVSRRSLDFACRGGYVTEI